MHILDCYSLEYVMRDLVKSALVFAVNLLVLDIVIVPFNALKHRDLDAAVDGQELQDVVALVL